MIVPGSTKGTFRLAAPGRRRAPSSADLDLTGCREFGDSEGSPERALTISEARYMVEAAHKYDRVTQVGTQQRSMPINNWASDLVKNGAIGKIKTVLAPNFVGPDRWPGGRRARDAPARSGEVIPPKEGLPCLAAWGARNAPYLLRITPARWGNW